MNSDNVTCCGYGLHWVKDGYVFQPHDMDCPALAAMVQLARDGICPQCRAELITEQDGGVIYCPKGHMRRLTGEAVLKAMDASGSSWIREEVTQ